MQLQTFAFALLSGMFFIESNVIYDSNMWIATFFFFCFVLEELDCI